MPSDFPPTQWGVVMDSAGRSTTRADQALAQLCQRYWPAVYATVRRRGCTPEDAEDLTQDFFAHILGRKWTGRADPGRGKFRTFLLTSLTNFLNDAHDRRRSEKRGGKFAFTSLDTAGAENSYTAFGGTAAEPGQTFDAQWARSLVDATMERLRRQYALEGRVAVFDTLRSFLTGDEGRSYQEAANSLELSIANVRTNIHRLRQRFGLMLREDVTSTVSNPREAEAELRYLCSIL